MDREIKVYSTDYETNSITNIRLVKLYDKNEKLLIIVPIEMVVVNTFLDNFIDRNDVYEEISASHKRFLMIVKELGGKIQKVVIDDMQDERIFATVYFTDYKGDEYNVQAEASDALALAILDQYDIYVKESMTDISKNTSKHRVYWYNNDDGELLAAARAASLDELIMLSIYEVKQLLEIAAGNEDFEFAARLKKALEVQQKKADDLAQKIDQYMHENPQQFLEDMIEEFRKHDMQIEIEYPEDDEN
jgi:bifunctional DNase/RNase